MSIDKIDMEHVVRPAENEVVRIVKWVRQNDGDQRQEGEKTRKVEVVVDEAADDVRELGLYQGLTESLQSGVNGAQS